MQSDVYTDIPSHTLYAMYDRLGTYNVDMKCRSWFEIHHIPSDDVKYTIESKYRHCIGRPLNSTEIRIHSTK